MSFEDGFNRTGAAKAAPAPPTTAEVTSWLCRLLQTTDSSYPTGGYAHSYGLEGLIQAGAVRDRATLRAFLLEAVLPGLRQADLPLVAHAWRAAGDENWARLGELTQLAKALKGPAELRGAAEKIGRQRAELAARLNPNSAAGGFLEQSLAQGWSFTAPVTVGVEMQAAGAPLEAALAGYFYATVSGLVAAAMKLLRLGQNAAQALLTEALAEAGAAAAHAIHVPVDEIGWANPWVDVASARHEIADARMFIS